MPKYSYHKLSGMFSKWGKEKQKIPTNNSVLKEKALATFRPDFAESQKPKRFRILMGLLTTAVAAYALLLVLDSPTRTIQEADQEYQYKSTAPPATDGARDLGLSDEVAVGLGKVENQLLKHVANRPNIIGQSGSPLDTREFLKIDYHADITTRNVEKQNRQIETMIRGYGGRIDQSNYTHEYANISFVIPKSSLEAFKNELRESMPESFYSESSYSTNLLPEKQFVEQQTDKTQDTISNLQTKKRQLTSNHNNKISNWQGQINTIARDIEILSKEITTDTLRQEIITLQIADLNTQINSLRQKIATENSQYQNNLYYLNNDITNANSQLKYLDDQDQKILDNVEMVEGSVSLRWISLVDVVNLYIPIYWILMIIPAATIIVYFLFGRRQELILP